MDYDENEFQGQNCNVSGEETSKFSPVLHPYALPKFDFDDELQGHLRFDNLVENEAFLGIHSQEDNKWIEDYSRGSGVFSSSATEPCPVLRSTNVWSEAASSESVEMLLNSVGQEETVIVAEESDACQKVGSVVEQMDTHFKEDDNKMNVTDSELQLVTEKVADHGSVLIAVEGVSSSPGVEITTHGKSYMLGPNDSSVPCGVPGIDDNLDSRIHKENVCKADTSSDKFPVNEMEDPSDSKMNTEDGNTMSQHIIVNTSILDNQDLHGANCFLTDRVKDAKEADIISEEVNVDGRVLKENSSDTVGGNLKSLSCSSSKTEIIELRPVEINASKLDKPPGFDVMESGDLHVGEECEKGNIISEVNVDGQVSKDVASETVSENLKNLSCSSSESESVELRTVEINASKLDKPPGFDVMESCDLHVGGECGKGDIISEEVNVDGQVSKDIASETVGGHLKNLSCSSSKSEIVELRPVEINASKLDKPPVFDVMGSGDIHVDEDCDEKVVFNKGSESYDVDLSDQTHIHQHFDKNIHNDLPKDFQQDSDVVAHAVEVITEKVESSAGPELITSRTTEVTSSSVERNFSMHVSNCQLGAGVSIRNNEAPAMSSLNNEVSDGEHSIENSKVGDDAVGFQQETSVEDHASSRTVSGLAALASNPNPVQPDLVVSSNGEEKPMFPNDSSEVKRDIVDPLNQGKLNEVALDGDSNQSNKSVCGSEFDAATSTEPEIHPLRNKVGANVNLAADQMGENPENKKAGSVETNLTPLKDTSQSTYDMDPVREFGKGSASNDKVELSQKAADHSLLVSGTISTASDSDRTGVFMNVTSHQSSTVAESPNTGIQAGQAEKNHKISDSPSSRLELFHNMHVPATEQRSDADASEIPANHEATGKDYRPAPSKISDSDVSTTPTTIDDTKDEKEEMLEQSLVKNVPPAGSVKSAPKEVQQGDVANNDRNFTFHIDLSSCVVGEYGQDKQSGLATQSSKPHKEASPSTPSIGSTKPEIPQRSNVSSQALDLEIVQGGSTGTPARKRGRPPGKVTTKQSAKKRSSFKETTPSTYSGNSNNRSSVSMSLSGTGQLQFEAVKLQDKFQHASTVSYASVPVAMPNLPDLNSSATPSVLVRQQFTDVQQMQLRAQIFVYGSLIQGAAPDETCMVAAFGTSDGGRSTWESVWRACVDKLQGAKSNLSKSENSVQPQSVPHPPEQTPAKKDAVQSTLLSTPVCPSSSKGTPSPVVNSMIPLSSPLWSASTPFLGLQSIGLQRNNVFDHRQTLSPAHPFQTPPSKNVTGNSSPWPPHASFPAPWINALQMSPLDVSARLPSTETVKLTPIKESVPPVASGATHSFPSITVHHSSSSVSAEPYTLPDMKRLPMPSGQKTAEPKSRKRKKSTAAENVNQILSSAQPRMETVPTPVPLFAQTRTDFTYAPVPTPVIPSHLSTSVVVSTPPFFGSKGNDTRIVATASPSNVADQPKIVEPNTELKSNLPDNALNKAEEAKQEGMEANKTTMLSGQKTAETKSRRRQKSIALDNVNQISFPAQARIEALPSLPLFAQARTDLAPAPAAHVFPSHLSTSVVSTPFFGSKGNDARVGSAAAPSYMADQPKVVQPNSEMKSNLLDNASDKAGESKQQAMDVNKTPMLSGEQTAEPKSRRRKKSIASENVTLISFPAQARIEPVTSPLPLFAQARTDWVPAPMPPHVSPSHLSASVVSIPPLFGSKGNDVRVGLTASPSYLADQPKRVEPNTEQKSNSPVDALIKAGEAEQQAEDAAALATAAVSHSQTIWDQLNKQKVLGLMPEVEVKLASAAVAVAAAAAVAKAAAAAAQVASNAASQAKMMADEAWILGRVDFSASGSAPFASNVENNVGLATTPLSITKAGDEGNFSSSILVAAKEAAKKRLEAASFASKRAENLDAIVKAAELAAAAVSQAGRIVAMGDPPSLAKLVEAGPAGYWRASQIPPEHPNEECSNIGSIQPTPSNAGRHLNDEPSRKKAKTASQGMSPLSREVFKDSEDASPSFFASNEKDSRTKRDSTASDLDKTIGVVPESETGSRPTSIISAQDDTNGIVALEGASIREGSIVEVKKEGNGFKEAWFSANVLSVENGKAFVAYAANKSGLPGLKEWIALEGDSSNAPRIRISPPVMDAQHEGTKKRRRGAMGDYAWSIGDKVDVWIKECWREGIVTDKNKIDVTTITVHFPAEGETSVVRAWHLRPTLIWQDGKWVESSSSRQKDPSREGDTPREKRLKFGGPSIEISKNDNVSKTFQLPGPERPEELQLLPLSDNDKRFNIGDNTKKDNKRDAPRTVRSGLQKDGPRVVFGIPKPGKKKKFMDVSKHYVTESSNKPDKLKQKYRTAKKDGKEKQQSDMMTKIPKPGKPMSSFGRTLPQKDKFPRSTLSTKRQAKKSASTDGSESESEKQSKLGTVSSTDRPAQGSFVFSSSALSRNMFTSNARSERVRRANRGPTSSKSTKEAKVSVDAGKEIPETAEPRRSNRRIQPTSRLLEGLQSSLVLPKFPSFGHDKGQRSHSRSTPKGKQ